VKLPVRDGDGFPLQRSGVTDVPGLYFAGMPWMPSEKSGFLIGVGDAAGSIASHIAANGRGATKMPAKGASAVATAAV